MGRLTENQKAWAALIVGAVACVGIGAALGLWIERTF